MVVSTSSKTRPCPLTVSFMAQPSLFRSTRRQRAARLATRDILKASRRSATQCSHVLGDLLAEFPLSDAVA